MIKKLCNIGELMCLGLYVVSAFFAISKKKMIPLLSLVLCHFSELFIVGLKTGKKENFSLAESIVNTMAFGFTWWLPLKMKK